MTVCYNFLAFKPEFLNGWVASGLRYNNWLWPMPVIPAAERKFLTPWQPPVPEEAEFLYVVVPPRARLLPDDKVTTCTINEQDKNVDLRIEWVGSNAAMPLVKLADTEVDGGAVQAILAAAH